MAGFFYKYVWRFYMVRNNRSKWQNASHKMNDLRYLLEDILSDFTPEEKESQRYTQLIESVEDNLEHAVQHATGKTRKNKRFKWVSWQSLSLFLTSPALFELIKLLINLLGD